MEEKSSPQIQFFCMGAGRTTIWDDNSNQNFY